MDGVHSAGATEQAALALAAAAGGLALGGALAAASS